MTAPTERQEQAEHPQPTLEDLARQVVALGDTIREHLESLGSKRTANEGGES